MVTVDDMITLQTAILEKLHLTWITVLKVLGDHGISETRDKEVFEALKGWGTAVFEAGESKGFRVRKDICTCLVGVDLRPGMLVQTKSGCPTHGDAVNTTAPHR